VYELLLHPTTIAGSATAAPVVGIWIACFSYISLMLFVAALRRSAVLALVLLTLSATYGFLAANVFYPQGSILLNIAGWCGIVSSILAFYVATASVINSESQMPVMPLGSMHPSARDGHAPMHTESTVVHETTVHEHVR
jgi:succinate-acetate transporter protein